MKKLSISNRLAKHLTISELSGHADTPSATIRYYIREGLLPEPIRTSMTMAYYTEDHIKGLHNIKMLKKRGLSLARIKETMNTGAPQSPRKKMIPADSLYSSKREEIVRVAVSLFRKKGYDATSIEEIIKKAGVGKDTFYQHFKNKELLFFECADRVFVDIGMENPQIRKEEDVMQRLWKRALFFGRSHQHMVDMMNIVRGASIKENTNFKEKLAEVIENLTLPIQEELETAIAEKRIKLTDSKLMAYLLVGAVESITYYHRDTKVNIDDLMRQGWDVAFHGTYPAAHTRNAISAKNPAPAYRESGSTQTQHLPSERREKIIAAAVELFSRKGYAETSIADIANRTRMSKEVFYHHFKNKNELFIECADKIFHDMYKHVWRKIKEEPDMLKRLWKRINAFFDSHPQWVVMMDLVRGLSVSENTVFKKKLLQLVRQMLGPIILEIEQLRQEGRLRKDIDSAVAGYVFMGMVEFGATLIDHKIYSRKKVTEYLDKILQHGVLG